MPFEGRYCTFKLGSEFFGVEASQVLEVLRAPSLFPVPLASGSVKGLLNLRGQILTVLDVRPSLGLPSPEEHGTTMGMILKCQGEKFALEVDSIGDVLDVDPDSFEEPPPTLNGKARELIQGAFKLKDRLLLVLDLEKAAQA